MLTSATRKRENRNREVSPEYTDLRNTFFKKMAEQNEDAPKEQNQSLNLPPDEQDVHNLEIPSPVKLKPMPDSYKKQEMESQDFPRIPPNGLSHKDSQNHNSKLHSSSDLDSTLV